MQHLVYKCPKCQNTLLVSNKMLHDLRCTEENPATYENFISQQPQPSLEESTRKSNNFNTPQRFSRRMSIKHHDGTMTLYAHGTPDSRLVNVGDEVLQRSSYNAIRNNWKFNRSTSSLGNI